MFLLLNDNTSDGVGFFYQLSIFNFYDVDDIDDDDVKVVEYIDAVGDFGKVYTMSAS